jgi:hypothetical protein
MRPGIARRYRNCEPFDATAFGRAITRSEPGNVSHESNVIFETCAVEIPLSSTANGGESRRGPSDRSLNSR